MITIVIMSICLLAVRIFVKDMRTKNGITLCTLPLLILFTLFESFYLWMKLQFNRISLAVILVAFIFVVLLVNTTITVVKNNKDKIIEEDGEGSEEDGEIKETSSVEAPVVWEEPAAEKE